MKPPQPIIYGEPVRSIPEHDVCILDPAKPPCTAFRPFGYDDSIYVWMDENCWGCTRLKWDGEPMESTCTEGSCMVCADVGANELSKYEMDFIGTTERNYVDGTCKLKSCCNKWSDDPDILEKEARIELINRLPQLFSDKDLSEPLTTLFL